MSPTEHPPAAHAEALAVRHAAGPLTGIAADLDLAADHRAAGRGAGIAFDQDLAARHAGADIGACIAIDEALDFGQCAADAVARAVGAYEPQRVGVVALDLEHIADGGPLARRANGDGLDVLQLLADEIERQQRREVEAFGAAFLDFESKRAHAMISLRWK